MSLEQASRYYALAEKYRKAGRNSIADALLRQADAEMEKGAMDANDVELPQYAQNVGNNLAQFAETAPNANGINSASMFNPAPVMQGHAQDVNAGAAVNQNNNQTNQNSNQNSNPNPYVPNADEMANMIDSDMFSNPQDWQQPYDVDLGLDNPNPNGNGKKQKKNTLGASLRRTLYPQLSKTYNDAANYDFGGSDVDDASLAAFKRLYEKDDYYQNPNRYGD